MIVRQVLVLAFGLGVVWDAVTTYLGTLIILGTENFITMGIAVVGTAMVIALNFSTKAIWRSGSYRERKPENILVRFVMLRLSWLLALAYDLWTSLTCNALYVLLPNIQSRDELSLIRMLSLLTVGQAIVVLFVTLLTVLSPSLFGHLSGLEADMLD